MAHTYEELKKKTVEDLREIAKGLDHEAVQGYTQMNKEHLLPALCTALGVDMHKHPHHDAVGIDKAKLKARMHELKAEKAKAVEAGDAAKLKAIRREYHRLNRRIRARDGLGPGALTPRRRGSGRRSRAGRSSGRGAPRLSARSRRRPATDRAEAEAEGSAARPAAAATSSARAASIDTSLSRKRLLLLDVPDAVALRRASPASRRTRSPGRGRRAGPRGRAPSRPRRSRSARARSCPPARRSSCGPCATRVEEVRVPVVDGLLDDVGDRRVEGAVGPERVG